jgi:DNA (cytosine-5)-methyltransferase 1
LSVTLTLGSLFDGIGGFPLAGVRQGLTPVWASEIEPFPILVTKTRFPEMLHVGDITKLKGAELAPVDTVCGGSPCQDYAEEKVIPKFKPLPLLDKGLRSKTSG